MKYSIFLAAIGLLFSFSVFSAANKTDRKGRKQGEWVKLYPNGKVMYEGSFKNNVPVGTFKRYTNTGVLKSVQVYSSNEASQVTFYNADGKTILSEGTFSGHDKTGVWKTYNDKGVLILSETYVQGKRNGISSSFKGDTLIDETPFVNDKMEGTRKAYLEKGVLYSETSYHEGLMDGPYTLYAGNKKPVQQGAFAKDKRVGLWKVFDPEGKLVDSTTYVDGKSVDEKKITAEDKKTNEENIKTAKSGKYIEPVKMFGGTVVSH